ncbi:MAG: ADP-ribosylation factor-like protein [Promethearchaeota archaeon]
MSEVKKVLVVGLNMAGKSSIINILRNKYNLMDNIKPTVGIERDELKILGIPILRWDLGGQQKFREGYLKDIKIFAETDSLFFVIDAIDLNKYDTAVQYYEDIINIFKRLDINPNIIVCIHKMDPNIRNNPKVVSSVDEVKKLFLSKSSGHEISFFITSIYDRITIVEAFSKTLTALVVTLKPFKKLLKSIVHQFGLDCLILFDEKLIILSESYENAEIEDLCLNMVYNGVSYLNSTNPQLINDYFANNFEFILNLRNKKKRFNFMKVKFKGWNLYLLAMSDERLNTDSIVTNFNLMVQQLKIPQD